jgi:hypothetical protein
MAPNRRSATAWLLAGLVALAAPAGCGSKPPEVDQAEVTPDPAVKPAPNGEPANVPPEAPAREAAPPKE